MYKIIIKVLFCSLLLMAVGCRKDDHNIKPVVEIDPPIEYEVETQLVGLVSSTNGEPLPGATILTRGMTTLTDDNGFFKFDDIILDGSSSLVRVEKEGHFIAYKNVYPTREEKSVVFFTLLDKGEPQTLSAISGGEVTIDDMAKVSFPENGFVDDNGNDYTGEVKLYTTYLDPTVGQTFETMPGNLGGIDKVGVQVQLGTYGMIGVELEGSSGQSLQLKDGSNATIEMEIPNAIVASAPSTIPLWHFDESEATWIEEGSATKVDNRYVGEVSHFSFWNCDISWPSVKLKLTLLDDNSNPVNHHLVVIEADGVGSATGYTNLFGEVCGLVPLDTELTLVIYSCGEKVVEQLLGTLTVDTDLGEVNIEQLENSSLITGNLFDCLNQPNDDAYGILTIEGYSNQLIIAENNGEISQSVVLCTNLDNTINFYDAEDITTTESFVLDPNIPENYLGDVTVCDQLDEYIKYEVFGGDGPILLLDPFVELADESLFKIKVANSFELIVDDVIPNSTLNPQTVWTHSFGNGITESYVCNTEYPCDNFTVSTLELGTVVDEYITGTFVGTVYDLPYGEPIEIFGEFKVKVDLAYQSASVSGLIWFDSDGNGIRTSMDPHSFPFGSLVIHNNVNGVENVFENISIDQDGYYEINKLRPGDYTVIHGGGSEFVEPTLVDQGSDDSIDNDFAGDWEEKTVDITLTEGQILENLDCGLLPADEFSVNLTHQGCQSETEFNVNIYGTIPPFTVKVDGVTEFTTSDYVFTIDRPTGQTYEVEVTDGFGVTQTASYYLPNFGIFLSLNVFEDLQPTNGTFQGGEEFLDGITVEVYDIDGILVESIVSNSTYNFIDVPELEEGDYYFKTILPVGYQNTVLPNSGIGNIIDPDTGISDLISIVCNESYILFLGIVEE